MAPCPFYATVGNTECTVCQEGLVEGTGVSDSSGVPNCSPVTSPSLTEGRQANYSTSLNRRVFSIKARDLVYKM